MASIANRRSVMVLYSDTISPASHCVRLVLGEKDINVEINYVEDGERPEALIEINPYNSVLTLIDRDLVLYDEQIIMEYLDERFPHPPLLPVDPVIRAGNRQLRFRVLKDLYSLIDDIESSDSSKVSNAQKTMKDNLTAIVPAFVHKPYFMSDEYTLVDCCMAPLLWRLPEYGVKLPASARPLEQYADRLFERDAFQSSLSEAEREIRGLITI
ncbi:MAG: glutathione S-transferase N-terminal domain-containing protein [Gammaproteobacteria bacterium]|nr:glutathione S-transferase N-terminal domain-containing protein [Gammaproteobacteria bacterium]